MSLPLTSFFALFVFLSLSLLPPFTMSTLLCFSSPYPSLFLISVSGPVDISLMSKCAPCLAAPCQNNGTCVSDATGSYHCTCPFGFKVRHNKYCNSRGSIFEVEGEETCWSLMTVEPTLHRLKSTAVN